MLETLVELLGSPPTQVGVIDWTAVERELGASLPGDYKRFVSTYGAGGIDGFLSVFTPAGPTQWVDLVWRSGAPGRAHLSREEQHPPFDAFPAPGGLLAFGQTDNGDVLYWRTQADPDQWTVLVYQGRGFEYFEFSGPMTNFLQSVLSGEVQVSLFPDDFPSDSPKFTPNANV